MSDKPIFPALTDFEATRQTLQLYSRVVGVVPRAHCDFHPKWWHISLKVEPGGLITNPAALPEGGEFRVKMDLNQHKILLLVDGGLHNEISMTAGLTANQMADEILRDVADLGLTAEYATEKYNNDDPREYNPAAAENYLTALVNADRIFKAHRATLSGEVGPVQVWPHGFDLDFEWFGTRVETYEEEVDVLDDDGNQVMVGTGEHVTKKRPKLNPEYDSSRPYVRRQDRPEWNCVGLLGRIAVRKGQATNVNWIKIKDNSWEIILYPNIEFHFPT